MQHLVMIALYLMEPSGSLGILSSDILIASVYLLFVNGKRIIAERSLHIVRKCMFSACI